MKNWLWLLLVVVVSGTLACYTQGQSPSQDTSPPNMPPKVPQVEMALVKLTLQTSQSFLVTGEKQKCVLTVTNNSARVLVITAVTFPDNERMAAILLEKQAYGHIYKDETQDAYIYDSMAQRATHLPFHYGLLLPGANCTIVLELLMLKPKERIAVHYLAADKPYDGTYASLAPLELYAPPAKDATSENPAQVKEFYLPASKEALERFRTARELISAADVLNVLIPNIKNIINRSCEYAATAQEGLKFSEEKAKTAVARLMPNMGFTLYYTNRLGGYLVAPQDSKIPCWLLASPDQEQHGKQFPHDGGWVVELYENPMAAKLRVGEQQEGFGPEKRPANRKFWGKWDVYYGDGMYTSGEFIDVKPSEWPEIFEKSVKEGGKIAKVFYYMESFYYKLTLPAK